VSEVTTIGLDVAKDVFDAHGADQRGGMILSRRLTRGKLLDFFAAQPRWWKRRHMAARITGRASCGQWDTRCG